MLQVVFVKCHDQLLGSSLLAFAAGLRYTCSNIHSLKPAWPLYVRGHKDRWPVHTVIDNIMDHDIQAVLYGITEDIRELSGNISLGDNLSADRIIDVMIDVRDLIRETHDLSLQRRRVS